MSPAVRKLVLSVHIIVSVGWIGAIAAYLALDVLVATSQDETMLRMAYVGMDLIVRTVIVPLALAALVTGVAISLGTKWGLFRNYWVIISLVLTLGATGVLLIETQTIGSFADVASDPGASADQLRGMGNTLAHSIGGILVLLVVLLLNMYKPRGMTPYGWRKTQSER